MKKIVKLTISLLAVIILTIGLSIPIGGFPAVGDILNPYDGIYETARLANKPKEDVIQSNQISNKVNVLRDNYGVPRVFAENDEALFYTLGYLHAQDRLFQMDMQRRLAKGKLAEIIGKSQLEKDKKMRKIRLTLGAKSALDNIRGTELMNYVEAYCAGVNKRINEGNLPVEFELLQYKPNKWKPIDTFAIAKLVSWGLSGTLKPLKQEKLKQKIGKNAWEELHPKKNPYLVPIHEPPYSYATPEENVLSEPKITQEATEYLNNLQSTLTLFSESKPGIGSNNWVVSDENSQTDGSILASDPHLTLPLPSFWYQAYLKSGEGYNTMGVTIPGAPVILIGANDNIAWGMTNVTADDSDFYRYQTKMTSDGQKYLYDNEWREFEKEEETIEVKGAEGIHITLKSTVHGPVVGTIDNEPIAMNWTGYHSWSELKSMVMINKAENLEEFEEGLKYWHVPPQNFAFADKNGNIGLFSAGWYPIRENGVDPTGVQNGSDSKNDWKGYVPFGEIPHTVNPPEGHLSSANQDPVTENYPYYIGRHYRPCYRGRRINYLLSSKKSHSISDFKEYQTDILSQAAKEMVPILLEIVQGKELDSLEEEAVQRLKDWDYKMREDGSAPLIWTIWEIKYFRNIFEDEYKKENATGLPLPDPIMGEKLLKEEPNSHWFDNVYTDKQENREDIVLKSFTEALQLLREHFGQDTQAWEWGKVNKYYFEHLTGIKALSYGPVPASGGRVTLKVAPFQSVHPDLDKIGENENLEFRDIHGPSFRQIAVPGEKYLCALPGGQSGNPLSPHYTDRLKMYLDQDYVELTLPDTEEAMDNDLIESKLIIKPEGGSNE